MTEAIGLRAVLDLGGFSGNVNIYLKGVNQITGATQGAGKAVGGLGGILPGLSSALGGVATVAAGMVTANLFGKIAEGVGAFASTGLNAVNTAQRLEAGMNALFAANSLYEKSTRTVMTAVTQQGMSDEELAQRHDELSASINYQKASIQEQIEKIRQLTATWGADGLETLQQKARLEQMQIELQGTEADLAGLTKTQTKYTESTVTSYKQVRSLAEAQKLAQQETVKLLRFVDRLSIISPFEQEQVATVAKYAVAAGLAEKDTEAFTAGFLDLAAAVGISSDSLGFAADQLLQVSKVGKLTEIDLRQLRRLGIDLEKIIGVQMGMSIEEFNAKAEKSPEVFNELFNAVTEFSGNTFAGATERMSLSLGGLMSTASDIIRVGARDFFRPLVEAASPFAKEALDQIGAFFLSGGMEQLGQQVATIFGKGLGRVSLIAQLLGQGNISGGLRLIGYEFGKLWQIIQPYLQSALDNVVMFLNSQIQTYAPVVGARLQLWGQEFWGWLRNTVIPQIPAELTNLVTGVTEFLRSEWPRIRTELAAQSKAFWDWVGPAAAEGVSALGQLTNTFIAWALSPETQAQLSAAGFQVGQFLIDAIGQSTADQGKAQNLLLQLAGALATAAIGITGSLIMIGGQILAGIITGMAQKAGVDLQPWTISQFQQFATWIGEIDWTAVGFGLMTKIQAGIQQTIGMISQAFSTGIKAWMNVITKTDWTTLGKSIIDGILKGINQNTNKIIERLKSLAKEWFANMASEIGFGSPATLFIPLGASIPQGVAVGIGQTAGLVQSAFDKMFNIDRSVAGNAAIAKYARQQTEHYQESRQFDDARGQMIRETLEKIFRVSGSEILKTADPIAEMQRRLFEAMPGFRGADMTAGMLRGSAQAFINAALKGAANAAAALQKIIVEGSRKAIDFAGSLMDVATAGAQQLNSEIDMLAQLLNTDASEFMLDGQIYSAAEATDLLNAKMAEQAAIQDDLLQLQQAQSQLNFLEKQLSLIETISKAGLNPADVLGGADLSTVGGLVAATNQAIASIIGQVSSDIGAYTPVQGSQTINNHAVNLNMGGISVNNGMDIGALTSLIQRTVASGFG